MLTERLKMSKSLKLAAAFLTFATAAAAQDVAPSKDGGYGIGRAALPEEVAAWNTDIRPDGTGLPVGSGDVLTGEDIYVENCSVCHGDFGEAVGRWPVLAGGEGTLENKDPVKTIGSYWPYLSTVFDYVHRAMPFGHAASLTDDETYALTAYILYLNDMVDDDFTLSNENFTEVSMPNVDNFIDDDRAETEFPIFMAEACMENCKDGVEITMHASVVDVTPEETAAKAGEAAAEAAAVDVAAAEPVVAAEPATEAAEPATEAAAEPAPVAVAAADPALIAAGEKAFRQCKSCHMVGEGAQNRVGPELNGIMGRTVGAIPDFRYSNVFQDAMAAGEVWDNDTLHAFLANPKDAMPGTKMSFRGVRDAADIDSLIAYLQSADPS
jgi:cytochrome c